MTYSIKDLATLAGISPRTLRYYDQIGLLSPGRIQTNEYREYTQNDVDILQEILFFRDLEVPLMEIKRMIQNPAFDSIHVIQDYHHELLKRRDKLNMLIETVEKTLWSRKGLIIMSNREKFAGLRAEMLRENHEKYDKEISMKYGEEAVLESNQIFSDMKPEDVEAMNRIGLEIKTLLEKAVLNREEPSGEVGLRIAKLHKKWLSYTWWVCMWRMTASRSITMQMSKAARSSCNKPY
jgi:DNA-binding transcriptional MerR regulator